MSMHKDKDAVSHTHPGSKAYSAGVESPEPVIREYEYNCINYWLNGRYYSQDISPGISTLDFLNRRLNMYGTKCSCNEGDCGACTVVIASVEDYKISYQAINSCLYPAAKLHHKHLITIEGLGTPDALHPIQQAMLDFHATQCGYCTPGFVMSLFALLLNIEHPDNTQILSALEGNLCRCTGYESILKAANHLSQHIDSKGIKPIWCSNIEAAMLRFAKPIGYKQVAITQLHLSQKYYLPGSLEEYHSFVTRAWDEDFRIINGGTDLMVQVNIQRKRFPVLIDISHIPEMHHINEDESNIFIGGASTYAETLRSEIIGKHLPALHYMCDRIASAQIRNFATIAGNIANASPIGDTLPLLLVSAAELEILCLSGIKRIPLSEFFLGYRQTALAKGDLILRIIIPKQERGSRIRCSKTSKRKSVDISAVCSACKIVIEKGKISYGSLAFGGVAERPLLSKVFPKAVSGKMCSELEVSDIAAGVAEEFQPLSDVRGSAQYRHRVIVNSIKSYLSSIKDRRGGRQ